MKHLRVIAMILAILMVASVAMACNNSGDTDATTTTTTSSKKTTTTLPPPPDDDLDEEEYEADTPITGEEFQAWHDSFGKATIIEFTSDVNQFNEQEAVEFMFDGADGCINADVAATKHAGGTNNSEANIVITVAPGTKLVAYSLITGADAAEWGRTPSEWKVFATNVDPATATEDDWTEIDYVFEGNTANENSTPYGYTVDEDKQGEYTYYKFQFLFGIGTTLSQFQLNEMYLYIPA